MKVRIPSVIIVLAILVPAAAAVPADQAIRLKVTAELANIRLKPSIGSVIIRQIPQGDILEALRKEGEWYLVKLEPDDRGNVSGYVHESLVLPLEETDRAGRKAQPIEPIIKPPAERGAAEQPPVVNQAGTLSAAGEAGWSVAVTAGGQYALGGEINSGAQAFADFFATRSGVPGDVEVSPAHLSFVFGGEISFDLARGVAVVVGADFYSASVESQVAYARTKATDLFTAKPRFQAVPIRLGIALYPARTVALKAGISYTIARCGYSFSYAQDTFSQEMVGEADGAGVGAWAALALELPLSDSLAFTIEATGHYAPLQGFEGTGIYSDSTTTTTREETGKLWAYDYTQSGQTISPLILIRAQRPSEAYVADAREAKIDFSGVSLKAGIKVRF
jgi:hypothetical protein